MSGQRVKGQGSGFGVYGLGTCIERTRYASQNGPFSFVALIVELLVHGHSINRHFDRVSGRNRLRSLRGFLGIFHTVWVAP